MPLLSPSPPNLISSPFPFALLPSFSALLNNFPQALYPLGHALATPLADIAPALALTALFFSSTLYTEAITVKKYPVAYKAYRERVGMFGIIRTFEMGLWLAWTGRKEEVDALVWGDSEKAQKKE